MTTREVNVLVVDDEPSLRKVFRTSLTASGFAIAEARSGEEAVEILPQRPFDLVLLDINMPGIGGVEACREIRALAPKIGIVMVTVRDAEHDKEISQALSISTTMHYYLTDAVLTLLNLENYRPILEQCMKGVIARR